MTTHLLPSLERLSIEELMRLQADACAQLARLPAWHPLHLKAQSVLDVILDVLTKRLDNEIVLDELNRLYAL